MPLLFNDALDDTPMFERVESFGGMDAYHGRTLLQPDQCSELMNCLLADNGVVKTRPGFKEIAPTDENRPFFTSQTPIQGLAFYDSPTHQQIVAFAEGVPYTFGGTSWDEAAGFVANETNPVAMAQLNDKLYISDGETYWQSWNGTTFTALDDAAATAAGTNPPKTATIMISHAGRIFASGVSATPDQLYVSNLGDAGEGKWDVVAMSLRPGRGESGRIIALAGLANFWVAIFKDQSIYMLNANPAAASSAWNIQFLGNGFSAIGKRAVCVSGGDCFFIGRDGVRSIKRLVTAEDQYEISAPLSLPMQPYIDRINWSYAYKSVAFCYRHLLFFAVPLDAATSPDYVMVFNQRTGTWCGYWYGINPTAMCISRFNDIQALIMGDSTGRVAEWMDRESEESDDTFKDLAANIATRLVSRSFLFQEPVSNKDGFYAEIRFLRTKTNVNVAILYDESVATLTTKSLDITQNELPLDMRPGTAEEGGGFDLAIVGPSTVRIPLDSFGTFNEAGIKIESAAGKIEVKNLTMAAFVNTIENE